MKILNLLMVVFIIIAVPCMVNAGTAYYVDPSAVTNGDGTYASPWNNIGSVNNHSFDTGDDVYFKVNTTCTFTQTNQRLVIHWGGTSGDRAIIGAYYGNGLFGLNGNPRPILDGENTFPKSATSEPSESPLVGTNGYSYITIQDLQVDNTYGYGISLKNSDYGIIDNCSTDHSGRIGIGVALSSNCIISDNIVNDAYYYKGTGDCIDVTGLGAGGEGTTVNNLVTGNIVSNCNEGIGVYKTATYTTVEYNVVYDSDYSIYIANSKYTTCRYNLVYTSTSAQTKGRGISNDNEKYLNFCFTGGDKIYGNIVANMTQGIFISNQCGANTDPAYPNCNTNCNTNDVLVYNNTLVDNDINIRIVRDDAGWTGNEIKNNISLTLTGGTVHASNYSPSGFTWSHNLFDDAVSGNAATNAIIGNPGLNKTSGWRSLSAENVEGTEFALTVASDAIDAGISISGYDDRITFADFTADPITVTTAVDSNPDIGAWKYTNGGVNTAPVVNAGTDQTITLPAQAVLDGTVTDDNLPNPPGTVTTTWTKQSGPGNVTFGNASAVDTTADFSLAGTYILRLSADDSELQASDDISITVNGDTTPPEAPTGLTIIE